ncbi:uncharacterized protein TrAtP1_005496 [Trichoderma atroviride]|uniref:uncharacterized protein n=1 Tax=Hypocrea atroviridis TaxID=63577 RepID=UPI00331A768D|nr:hypothetical protein TrAtP1_005496 [Trichoderma atroviride]
MARSAASPSGHANAEQLSLWPERAARLNGEDFDVRHEAVATSTRHAALALRLSSMRVQP